MHQYFHTTFGFCLWDILALIVLVLLVVVLVVHIVRQKKRQHDLEKQLNKNGTLPGSPMGPAAK